LYFFVCGVHQKNQYCSRRDEEIRQLKHDNEVLKEERGFLKKHDVLREGVAVTARPL
jgi:hypothetical protein